MTSQSCPWLELPHPVRLKFHRRFTPVSHSPTPFVLRRYDDVSGRNWVMFGKSKHSGHPARIKAAAANQGATNDVVTCPSDFGFQAAATMRSAGRRARPAGMARLMDLNAFRPRVEAVAAAGTTWKPGDARIAGTETGESTRLHADRQRSRQVFRRPSPIGESLQDRGRQTARRNLEESTLFRGPAHNLPNRKDWRAVEKQLLRDCGSEDGVPSRRRSKADQPS